MGVNDVTMVCYTCVQAMFTWCLRETQGAEVLLRDVPAKCLQLLLDYMYQGKLPLDNDNIQAVAAAAFLLDVDGAFRWEKLLELCGFWFVFKPNLYQKNLYIYISCNKLNSSSTVNLCLATLRAGSVRTTWRQIWTPPTVLVCTTGLEIWGPQV